MAQSLQTLLAAGMKYYREQRFAEAKRSFREAVAVDPDCDAALHMLGVLAFKSGRIPEAVELVEQAVDRADNPAEYRNTLGVIHSSAARYDLAAKNFSAVLNDHPDNVVTLNNLGRCLRHLAHFDSADRCFRKALRIQPSNVVTLRNLADLRYDMGKLDESERLYRQAMAVRPGSAQAYTGLGIVQVARGQFTAAQESFRKAIDLEPRGPAPYGHLADITAITEDDPTCRTAEAMADNDRTSPNDRATFCFALGKMHEKQGARSKAFERYDLGNRIRRQSRGRSFSIEAFEREIRTLTDLFDRELFERCSFPRHPSEKPLFVVGMPRSGTSLVEQILAGHSAVRGAGELPHMKKISVELVGSPVNRSRIEALVDMDPDTLTGHAETYLSSLPALPAGVERVVDKMPHNFLHVWLISLLFVHARIIHCTRDPMDTCLSCYCTDFEEAHGYSYDLATLGRYHRAYDALMKHWRAVLPERLYEVNYENLIDEPQATARALIEHVGLAWEERCLQFHRNKSVVTTASSAQVRRPLYGSSVGKARRYRQFLGALSEALYGAGSNQGEE